LGGAPLIVGGWAIDLMQHAPLAGVYVVIDDHAPVQVQYRLPRPDVAAALGDATLAPVGYAAAIPIAMLTSGPHTVQIVAIFDGGHAYEYAGTLSFEVR
jgi:hypothetical protein